MISLIRIDDRLIHGQVMTVWVRHFSATHILVVDDVTAADLFSRQVMQLAMPRGMALTISPLATAPGQLRDAAEDASRTLVLLRSVDAAVQLHSHFPYQALNVGGIGMTHGRKLLWRSIAASPEEVALLSGLQQAGVDVYLQMIPADQRYSLTSALDGHP